ncbi:MAG TPA: hypothetical protein VJV23_07945 [Candidatus Polarisedimenticolia bacterium]|nr:hypothetical protein [Candidatus Polarisedimenticolia bacterium]
MRAIACLVLAASMLSSPSWAAQPGSEAPDFELRSSEGAAARLSGLRGKSHVVLVFFRGTW